MYIYIISINGESVATLTITLRIIISCNYITIYILPLLINI